MNMLKIPFCFANWALLNYHIWITSLDFIFPLWKTNNRSQLMIHFTRSSRIFIKLLQVVLFYQDEHLYNLSFPAQLVRR